jgi:hypothetical protein
MQLHDSDVFIHEKEHKFNKLEREEEYQGIDLVHLFTIKKNM